MGRRKDRDPETITICGQDVEIHYLRDLEDCDGCYYPGSKRIEIDLNAKGRTPEQLLLHEMIHAVLDCSGLNDLLTTQVEEAIVSGLEQGLFQHLRLKAREKL